MNDSILVVVKIPVVNWHNISSLESVTDTWRTLRDWTLDLRNRFVPYSPKKTGKGVPWIRSRAGETGCLFLF